MAATVVKATGATIVGTIDQIVALLSRLGDMSPAVFDFTGANFVVLAEPVTTEQLQLAPQSVPKG